ncbi:MAG: DUF4234 domain-containing protein [Ramlibacter sp.]|nr:DUF4234 domain-containing protein [Ramlibacter sp.]
MTPNDNPPPKLHWAIVLLLSIVTLGLFYFIWMFVQSRWARRVNPDSSATSLLIVYAALSIIGEIVSEISGRGSNGAIAGGFLLLAGTVVGVFGFISIRRTMLNRYGGQSGASLPTSSALTIFLGLLYLQHHMTRLAKRSP